MKISIIIATYNAEKTLQRCLDSIIFQLTSETELILVDGGSKDKTNAVINSYGDKIAVHISEPDNGIYDAWNKGIMASHGEWIMFVGADDRLKPCAIALNLSFINAQNKDLDLISSRRMMVTIDDKEIYKVGKQWSWPSCLYGMPISHPGALHNRKLFDEVGMYDTKYKIAADYELLLRKGCKLKTAYFDDVTLLVSEGGISDSYAAIREYHNVLKHCPHVYCVKSLYLFMNMYIHFSVKKFFKMLGVNIHS